MTDDPQWNFRQIAEKTPLTFSCIENEKVRFFENPHIPAKEVIDQILPLQDKVSIVTMPPCSPDTIKALEAGLPVLSAIVIIDANPDRLKAWKKLIKPYQFKKVKTLLLTKDHITDKDNFIDLFPPDFASLTLWRVSLYFAPGYVIGEKVFCNYAKDVLELARQSLTMKVKYHAGDMWHHMLNQLTTMNDPSIKKHTFKQDKRRRPFVIVGAGPSLDDNIEILKKYQDKVIILCCERAIGTLKAHKLKPDYILTVENVLGMWFHFEQHLDFIKDIPLISPFLISHVVARNYPGDRVFVKIKGGEEWLNPLADFTAVDLGHCVGQFGFNVAESLNPSQIILIGNDLAFKDGRSHTSHTHSDAVIKKSITIKGFYDDTVETSRTFKFYIEGFQTMIRKCKVPVINATEGGAYLPGAKHKGLEETLQKLPTCYSLEYDLISATRVETFYNSIVKDIFDLHKTLFTKQAELTTLNRDKPIAFFQFIPDDLQVIINHFMNPEFFLKYYDIIGNYHPMRFNEYVETLKMLLGMSSYACEFILNINAVGKYEGCNEKNVLILQPEGKDINWIREEYPQLNCSVAPAMGQLTKLWEIIVTQKIGTIISFEKQISPDTWTIPRVKCIDLREGSLGSYHPVENYTVAAMSQSQLDSWPKKLNAGVPTNTIEHLLGQLK